MTTKKHIMSVSSLILVSPMVVAQVNGATLFGTSSSTSFGQRANFGGVTTVGSTDNASDGGDGTMSSIISTTNLRGNAAARSSISTLVPSIGSRAFSNTTNDVANGAAGANGAYRFNSTVSGTITLSFAFTATQAANGADTFMRFQGGLISDITDIYYSRSQYYEGGGTLEDSFRFEFNQTSGSNISETGTLTMTAQPGQIFNVMLGLQTSAGGAGASADAYGTLTGTLSSDVAGASFSVVPEPSSVALFSLGSLLILRRRRS